MTPIHINMNMKAEAEAILEGVLNRRNWTVDLRDALADRLADVVDRAFSSADKRVFKR